MSLENTPHNTTQELIKSKPLKPASFFWEKIIFFAVITCILFFIIGFIQDKADETPLSDEIKSTQSMESTVVSVFCPYAQEPFDFSAEGTGGSGIIIDVKGKVLTNFHIIADEEDMGKPMPLHEKGCFVLLPESETGFSGDIYMAQPIFYKWTSPYYDLAYLQIYGVYSDEEGPYGDYPREFEHISENYCSSESLALGMPIIALGYPDVTDGYSLTIAEGILSAFSEYGSFYSTAVLSSGGSGGLVLGNDNCIAGVYAGVVFDEYVTFGEIYHAEEVADFIEKSKKIDAVGKDEEITLETE